MRAVAVRDWGGRDRMELLDLEPPPVAPDGVLVRVRAAGLNPVDTKVREGRLAGMFPSHFPVVLGWDAAGVVEKVGPAVTWFKPGDAVYGYCRRHDLRLRHLRGATPPVPEGYLAHMPRELSFEEAGATAAGGADRPPGDRALAACAAARRSSCPAGRGAWATSWSSSPVARGARVIASASPGQPRLPA